MRSVFHKSRKGFISLKKTDALYQSIGLFLYGRLLLQIGQGYITVQNILQGNGVQIMVDHRAEALPYR